MKRIYHHYTKWEDYKAGFYGNISGKNKELLMQKVKEMFSSTDLTRENMLRVINEWKYSCEHNLTNPSLNRIAYIGQGACCLYAEIPSMITMNVWSSLDNMTRINADKIALITIKEWEQKKKLENIFQNGKKGIIQKEYQMKLQLN